MNLKKKKILKLIPLLEVIICIIIFIISYLLKNKVTIPTYTYVNNKIVTHSWRVIYDDSLKVLCFIIAVTAIVSTVIWILQKIKFKEKILKNILSVFLSLILCGIILTFCSVIISGLWTKEDYSPVYYEFSDNKHTIIIEETSFMLYGGGTIYQLLDNNKAVILETFNTDDGGRNNGNYDIQWYDEYAEITYNTFITSDSKCTDKIVFLG